MGKKYRNRSSDGFVQCLERRFLLSRGFPQGVENAIAYDSGSGKLYVAYYEQPVGGGAGGILKSAIRKADGSWDPAGELTIDASPDAGHYVTMTLDFTNLPGVAYYDGTRSVLKYSHFDGTAWSTPVDADATTGLNVGLYPSLAYNNSAQNRPSITYFEKTLHFRELRFVARGGGGVWGASQVLDTTAEAGRYSSLKLNAAGNWAVAYDHLTTGNGGDARYMEQTSGGVWVQNSFQNIDHSNQGGGYESLQFIGGEPCFSFYDSYFADLKFARRVSGTWQPAVVVSANDTEGLYTNLLVQSTGKVRIVYLDQNTLGYPTIRVADEPTNWQTDPWNISLRLSSGGGPEGKAVRISDSEFFYTRVGDNPSSPTVFVSNYPNEGKNYVQSTSSAFSGGARYGHATVVFPDAANGGVSTMWTLGGFTSTYSNDVYSSTDGVSWTLRSTTGVFSARTQFPAVVLNNKIYVIGGGTSAGLNGQLYSSSNGTTWQLVSTTHSLPARQGHTAVVLNGNIYVIGGQGASGLLNDVWKFDGTDWSQVANGGGSRFTPRDGHVSYAYDGKLWVASGYDGTFVNGDKLNDVWSSTDGGSTWTNVTSMMPAAFLPRSDASGIVFDNRMWILGGVRIGSAGYNDAYYSINGLNWFSATDTAEFQTRRDESTAVFNNRLFVIGGIGAAGVGNTVYYAKTSSTA